jgi:hypothetical protein
MRTIYIDERAHVVMREEHKIGDWIALYVRPESDPRYLVHACHKVPRSWWEAGALGVCITGGHRYSNRSN